MALSDQLGQALGHVPERARALGGRVVVAVLGPGGGTFTVDLDGPTVRPGGDPAPKVKLEARAADAKALFETTRAADVPALMGRVRVVGDAVHFNDFLRLVYEGRGLQGSFENAFYEELHARVPDPVYVFMNFGFATPGAADADVAWVRPEDWRWRHQMNLVSKLLDGLDLGDRALLDVGCGRGGTCSYLARYRPPRALVGLDFSLEAIRFCRATHQHPGLQFVRGDAQALPFADASFDVITNVESSHCYPSLPRFYAEVARVLKPGGRFAYTDCSAHPPETFEAQLATHGLRPAYYEDVTPGVIASLGADKDAFQALLTGFIDPKKGNEAVLRELVRGINVDRYGDFVAGRCRYYLWHLVRD